MRRPPNSLRLLLVSMVLVAGGSTLLAQGPGGVPGAPMQRLGPSRGPSNSLGTPGAPMSRMGKGGGGFSAAAPARRNYGGLTGVPGVMSSQNYRAGNFVGQARSGGVARSSAGIVSGVTRGSSNLQSSPR